MPRQNQGQWGQQWTSWFYNFLGIENSKIVNYETRWPRQKQKMLDLVLPLARDKILWYWCERMRTTLDSLLTMGEVSWWLFVNREIPATTGWRKVPMRGWSDVGCRYHWEPQLQEFSTIRTKMTNLKDRVTPMIGGFAWNAARLGNLDRTNRSKKIARDLQRKTRKVREYSDKGQTNTSGDEGKVHVVPVVVVVNISHWRWHWSFPISLCEISVLEDWCFWSGLFNSSIRERVG